MQVTSASRFARFAVKIFRVFGFVGQLWAGRFRKQPTDFVFRNFVDLL
jgi:hypothetical protein